MKRIVCPMWVNVLKLKTFKQISKCEENVALALKQSYKQNFGNRKKMSKIRISREQKW